MSENMLSIRDLKLISADAYASSGYADNERTL